MILFFFFKQKTAYEMRISDWSSDVCSSDLLTNDWSSLRFQPSLARQASEDLTLRASLALIEKRVVASPSVHIDLGIPIEVAFFSSTSHTHTRAILNRLRRSRYPFSRDEDEQIGRAHV